MSTSSISLFELTSERRGIGNTNPAPSGWVEGDSASEPEATAECYEAVGRDRRRS